MNIKSKVAAMVRSMSDDEILTLVGPQLAQLAPGVTVEADAPAAKEATPKAAKPRKERKARMTDNDKDKILKAVLGVFKRNNKGLAISEVMTKSKLDANAKPAVAGLLKAMVAAEPPELFKAGERRYTRYAVTAKAAQAAVDAAVGSNEKPAETKGDDK